MQTCLLTGPNKYWFQFVHINNLLSQMFTMTNCFYSTFSLFKKSLLAIFVNTLTLNWSQI